MKRLCTTYFECNIAVSMSTQIPHLVQSDMDNNGGVFLLS